MDQATKRTTITGIIVLCIIAFSPVFTADFVNYDDPEYVLNNIYIRHFSFENIKQIFFGRTTDLYIPLTVFSYQIEHSVFGESARSFHVINLLLHMINAVLLLFILLKLTVKNKLLIYFILLFFALNPLVTESVCWITERKDVLYCLFYFLSTLQFLSYTQHKKLKYLAYSFLFFVLACLSKPMAVSLPVLFSIYLMYTTQKLKVKEQLLLIPFYAISVIFAIISIYALSSLGTIKGNHVEYSILEKTVMVFSEIGYYFVKPFIPFNQQLFHLFPEKSKLLSNSDMRFFAFAGALIAGLILYQVFSKKYRLPGYLFLAWLIFLLPVLQIYSNTHSYVSERYFYISIIFPVSIAFIFLQKTTVKPPMYKYALVLLLVVFTALTFKRSTVWKNSKTLFEAELKADPKNPYALNNLGYDYNSKSDFASALPLLKKAIEADSTNALYFNNYGWALANTGQTDEAIIYFQKAITINSNYTEALNNMGICYMQKQNSEEAASCFKKAYAVSPNNGDVVFNLGLYYFNSNQKDLGLPMLQRAYELGNKKAFKYLNK